MVFILRLSIQLGTRNKEGYEIVTINLPDLPQFGIIGTLYLMAFAAFLLCWFSSRSIKASKDSTTSGFWVFIAIISGATLVIAFSTASIIMIVQNKS